MNPPAAAVPATSPATISRVGTDAAPSWLSERLASGAHPDAQRAFETARATLIAGRRIDMSALAAELGVDRTSLFRWVGNRDALLAEVLWSLAAPTLDASDTAVTADGADRVAGVLTRFVTALIEAAAFRGFLQREPTRALRITTTRSSPVQ